MVKSVLITLKVDIPDTEQSKDCTVTVGTASYAGNVTAVIVHTATATVPIATTVKITGPGLVITP